jgi:hypothetical protein
MPVLGEKFPDILFDGNLDPKKLVHGVLPESLQLRLDKNGEATFANLHLDRMKPEWILTGRYRVDRETAPYAGRHPAESDVELAAFEPIDPRAPAASAIYSSIPRKLSDWRLFTGPVADHRPAENVLPYELNTALYSDNTHKLRFIRLPAGTAMTYQSHDVFDFPDGTALVKTFAYPARARTVAATAAEETAVDRLQLLETRIESRIDGQWYGFSYVWNADQTDAELALGGSVLPVTTDAGRSHDYHVFSGLGRPGLARHPERCREIRRLEDADRRWPRIGRTSLRYHSGKTR